MQIESVGIARVCHEVNRAYCHAIGDLTPLSWEEAPEWQRESAVQGVLAHLKNPYMSPEQSHELWCEKKVADGWKYGPVKNADKKEHPCLLPYSELPVQQQVKDHLFGAVVDSMKGLV